MPACRPPEPFPIEQATELEFDSHAGGLVEIGYSGDAFHYDCESPRHSTHLAPYAMANRPVTNRDWIAFIEDRGYDKQTLWLSDGWATRRREVWDAPLYWWRQDDEWRSFTLRGAQPVALDSLVVHVSYYEADAFAHWAGSRLPTEAVRAQIGQGAPGAAGIQTPMIGIVADEAAAKAQFGPAWRTNCALSNQIFDPREMGLPTPGEENVCIEASVFGEMGYRPSLWRGRRQGLFAQHMHPFL